MRFGQGSFKHRRWRWGALLAALALVAIGILSLPFRYAYEPAVTSVLNDRWHFPHGAYDVWGKSLSSDDAQALRQSPSEGRELLPKNGAVPIDDQAIALGRASFYKETFGNEIFLTDILGMTDGPIGLLQYAQALVTLRGRGTTNLQVKVGWDAVVGGRKFVRGQLVDTGIDVAKGSFAPLGLAVVRSGGEIRVGITCALCHSTVDKRTGKVIHGATNSDLNAGLLLALASNSAAFFPHVALDSLDHFVSTGSAAVITSEGKLARLPDPDRLEQAVDRMLLQWPPGSFDSMVDLVSAPTQIPDSFTFEDYPYNWSGAFMAGPFHGLSVQSNNVHALNSDPFTHADASRALFGIDKEVYLATLLQRAATSRFRFDPHTRTVPSAFFARIDPTPGAPGLNQLVRVPTYPNASLIAPDGLWNSSPGKPVWQQVNAMSAWQNTLAPPLAPLTVSGEQHARGRAVFERAGCGRCHSGPGFTNHDIVPVEEIGTEPARARALHGTETIFTAPIALAFDQSVPLRAPARTLPVPTNQLDPKQIELAFAHGESKGGYKVPGLLGLFWSAPYLHDGGVAVGADWSKELGVAATSLRHVPVDPAQSLRALIDRNLRKRVVAANEAQPDLRAMHVRGEGHELWVDAQSGFEEAEQRALVDYLLTLGSETH